MAEAELARSRRAGRADGRDRQGREPSSACWPAGARASGRCRSACPRRRCCMRKIGSFGDPRLYALALVAEHLRQAASSRWCPQHMFVAGGGGGDGRVIGRRRPGPARHAHQPAGRREVRLQPRRQRQRRRPRQPRWPARPDRGAEGTDRKDDRSGHGRHAGRRRGRRGQRRRPGAGACPRRAVRVAGARQAGRPVGEELTAGPQGEWSRDGRGVGHCAARPPVISAARACGGTGNARSATVPRSGRSGRRSVRSHKM